MQAGCKNRAGGGMMQPARETPRTSSQCFVGFRKNRTPLLT